MQAKEGFLKLGGFSGIYKGIGAVFLGSIPGGFITFIHHPLTSPLHPGALFFAAYDTSKATLTSLELGIPMPVIHMLSASLGEVVRSRLCD
jgi:solute carrier family 25 (mitochondrial S-adenosylmethionine transporter), member 26